MCSGIRQNLKQQRNSASRSVRKSDITSLTSVYFEYFDDRCHFLGADVEHARKSRLSKASQVGLHIPASFCQWSMPWSFGGELSHFFLGGEFLRQLIIEVILIKHFLRTYAKFFP